MRQVRRGRDPPRHQRDSHRAHAVGERHRDRLMFGAYFFDLRDCVDLIRAQRDPVGRFD